MANLLNNYGQDYVTKQDYLDALKPYARSQHKDHRPWIGENLSAYTGRWMVNQPRSKDYDHSAYCDLVITGLIGLRPRADDTLEVNPLVPEGAWDYFCLDWIPYHGRNLTILWDRSGQRYGRGKGLRLFADGRLVAESDSLTRITGALPSRSNDLSALHVHAAPAAQENVDSLIEQLRDEDPEVRRRTA